MPSEKTELALLGIRDNILAAQRFTTGLSFVEFEKFDLHFYAVTRALEIVCEASRRLPEGFRQKHAALPWRQIIGVGNVFRHNYDNVAAAIVWQTVQERLTPLLAVVVSEIETLDAKH